MFRATKLGFSRIAENLGDRPPFAGFDAVVEIFKDPIQPLSEDTAHAAFPGSHESDEKNSIARRTAGGRPFGPRTLARLRIHRLARSLRQKLVAKSKPLADVDRKTLQATSLRQKLVVVMSRCVF